jgi:hypothetical protein
MNALVANRNTSDAASADNFRAGSDGERARALVERLRASGQRSTADILHELRQER